MPPITTRQSLVKLVEVHQKAIQAHLDREQDLAAAQIANDQCGGTADLTTLEKACDAARKHRRETHDAWAQEYFIEKPQ